MPPTPEHDHSHNTSLGRVVSSLSSFVLHAPLNLLNLVAVNGIFVLRPYAPQLIPIIVCLALVPLAVLLSLFAGWTVWRSLLVGWQVPLFFQYGYGMPFVMLQIERVLPYARAVIPYIQNSQQYDISISLSLPVSQSNLLLGNFMTNLTLLTPSNQTLASVSRPAIMVSPKASWLFFTKPNVINLDIPLLDSFIAKTTNIFAHVEIGRQDGWKSIGDGQGREVSLIAASLRGRAIPQGIRGLAIRFPLLATSLSATLFLTILCGIIGSCVLPTMFPVPTGQEDNEEIEHRSYQRQPKATRAKSELSPFVTTRARSNSTPLRRKKHRLSKRVVSNSRNIIKSEEVEGEEAPVTVIPPAQGTEEDVPEVSAHAAGPSNTTARETLRRRASRKFDSSEDDPLSESEEE